MESDGRDSILMAEICSGSAACKTSPRSARRLRMDLRRVRFISGVEALEPLEEIRRKRQRCDLSAAVYSAVFLKDPDSGSKMERVVGAAGNGSSTNPNSSSIPVQSSPAPTPVESGDTDQCPRFGTTSVCGRRRDMEDAVSVRPSFFRHDHQVERRYHFFGVYDGHGCSHVAASCRDLMHEMVAEELERLGSDPPPPVGWKELMERSFSRMDAEVVGSTRGPRNASCRCELQMPKCEHVGSTAVVAVVTADRIVVANCGDSRAVLCRKGVPVPLSVDHKPDRPDELERIQVAGGRVIYWDGARVLGVLAMSRAIGDGHLKPFVIPEPEVTVTERTAEDECLILASDGLWDVVTNEMACSIVRMCLRSNAPAEEDGVGGGDVASEGGSDKACSDSAMLLTKLALARHSSDNVSVVVIDLRRER